MASYRINGGPQDRRRKQGYPFRQRFLLELPNASARARGNAMSLRFAEDSQAENCSAAFWPVKK